jgi:SAM-dependent methyltransferase
MLPDSSTTLSLLPGFAIIAWMQQQLEAVSGSLLDAGCGNRPYLPLYADRVTRHVGLDAVAGDGVDVIAFADQFPFLDGVFETVVMTEVLEHVADAERAAAESYRVLKPGGMWIVTVPYIYPTHEAPHDHRRFTHFGLIALAERRGFEVVSVAAKGGELLLVAHWMLMFAVHAANGVGRVLRLPRPLSGSRAFRAPMVGAQHLAIACGAVRTPLTRSAMRASLGYMMSARKPLL